MTQTTVKILNARRANTRTRQVRAEWALTGVSSVEGRQQREVFHQAARRVLAAVGLPLARNLLAVHHAQHVACVRGESKPRHARARAEPHDRVSDENDHGRQQQAGPSQRLRVELGSELVLPRELHQELSRKREQTNAQQRGVPCRAPDQQAVEWFVASPRLHEFDSSSDDTTARVASIIM